jgi:hypothetical protein
MSNFNKLQLLVDKKLNIIYNKEEGSKIVQNVTFQSEGSPTDTQIAERDSKEQKEIIQHTICVVLWTRIRVDHMKVTSALYWRFYVNNLVTSLTTAELSENLWRKFQGKP